MLALEVVPLPVIDVDRAIAFYTGQAGDRVALCIRPLVADAPALSSGATSRPM